MGVFLARIGRYWDCFEEIEEYEIEVSKVKRIRKMNKKGKEDTGSTNNPDQEEAHDEKDLDLSSMQKLKPGRVATMDKTLYAKNIVLDDGDDNLEEVKPRPDTESSMSNINVEAHNEGQGENYKARLLKKKLERIRERRRQREQSSQLDVGIGQRRAGNKPHILNVHSNQDFFVDKEQIDEFDGGQGED